MACDFFNESTRSHTFLVNLSPWDNLFQGESISIDSFRNIKETLQKDFVIQSDQNLVEAIKEYLNTQAMFNGIDYTRFKESLDRNILNISTTPSVDPKASIKSDVDNNPALTNEEYQITVSPNEDVEDFNLSKEIATQELVSEIISGRKDVDYSSNIKSTLDLSNKFQTNSALYNRFVNGFKKDLFKVSFIDFDNGKIANTVKDMNLNIAQYKQDLLNNMTDFLQLPRTSLYDESGNFNLEEYNDIISKLDTYYDANNPTSRLNSINDRAFTKLSPNDKLFIDAYNSSIALENFDNLVNVLTNGLVYIDPRKFGIMTSNLNEVKYLPFKKNIIRQSFSTTNFETSIERETAAVTKAVIQNIKKLDLNGNWDGFSYLTVNDFNTATSKFNDSTLKNKYPELKDAHINPTQTYIKFFNRFFDSKGALEAFKHNDSFDNSTKDILYSIYKSIIDQSEGASSLYNIITKNQVGIDFNYFMDLMSYINKQGPSEYISYKFNLDTRQYEIDTFSNITYESTLKNYEINSANDINNLVNNDLYNIIKDESDGFGVKYNDDNTITLKLNNRSITLSPNMRMFKRDPFTLKDYNKTLTESLIIPNVDQSSRILNGEILDQDIMDGFKLFELLQFTTGFPFKNSSGQLYSRMSNEYKNEDNLKADLLSFLYTTLDTLRVLDNIHQEEVNNKSKLTPTEYLKIARKDRRFSSLSEEAFNRSFANPTINPKILISRNASGSGRSAIFKSIVSALSIINGDTNPSTYKNSDGDNVPSVGLMNLLKTIPDYIQIVKRYQEKALKHNTEFKNIYSNNIFFNSPELIKGVRLKTEFVTPNGTVIQKNKFNVAEYTTSSVILDFYKNLLDGNDINFLPTVYADKANQSLITISKDLKINDKSLKAVTASEIEQENRIRNKEYYTNVLNNLFNTYSKIGERLGIKIDSRIVDSTSKAGKVRAIKKNMDTINNMLSTRFKDVQAAATELMAEDRTFEWVEETHYSKVDGEMRMNPFIEYMSNVYKVSTTSDEGYNKFMKRSKDNFLQDIMDKNIKIDAEVFKFLYNDTDALPWIGKDGYMDIIRDGKMNPIFEKFFFLDGFLSNQFMQITAGEPYAHPSKLKKVKFKGNEDTYYMNDHAARLIAQYKRMVMMQGTIHNYYQAALEGTGSQIKCAVVKDIEAPVFNPSGETDNVKPLDGSMEVTGWQNELENNSMFSSTAGQNRKNFGYDINPIHGSATLYKCASFAIDNNVMRHSPEKIKLLQKMTDRKWSVPVLDLMKDFNGNSRTLNDVIGEDIYYYNANDGEYKQILDVVSLGDNMYSIVEVSVNEDGTQKTGSSPVVNPPVLIDTNFKLWKALGAQRSMSLNTENPVNSYLEPSETSVKAVAKFINKTGVYKTKQDLASIRQIPGNEAATIESNIYDISEDRLPDDRSDFISSTGDLKVILDQNYVYQPMKHSDIHYIINGSAIKVGARNTNPSTSRYDDSELNYFTVGSQYFGIQMNADHHADNSEVTESTQIISTLAANGHTQQLANKAYNALGSIVDLTLKEYLEAQKDTKAIQQYGEIRLGNKTKLYKVLTKSLLRALSTGSDSDALLNGYLNEISQEFENNLNKEFNTADFNFKTPFSAGSIHNQFITMITSKMNMDSIKRTFSGMGAVMKPSYGSMKFYHFDGTEGFVDINGNPVTLNGTYSEFDLERIANKAGYRGDEGYAAVDAFKDSASALNPTIKPSQLRFGDTVFDPTIGEDIEINTYDLYRKYKSWEGDITLTKDRRKELLPLNITFKINGVDAVYSIYDHPLVEEMFNLRNSKANSDILLQQQYAINKMLGLLDSGYYQLNSKMPNYQEILTQNPDIIYKVADGARVERAEFKNYTPEELMVKVSNLKIDPAEVVLSKIYQTKFFLRPGDSISDILNSNGRFFIEKLTKNYNTAKSEIQGDSNIDAILLNPSGANTKVIINDSVDKSNYIKDLVPIDIIKDNIDGEIWRMDEAGRKLYKIDGIQFYKDPKAQVPQEIIVIDPNNMTRLLDVSKDQNYDGIYYNFNEYNIDTLLTFFGTYDTKLLESFGNLERIQDKTEHVKNIYNRAIRDHINYQSAKIFRSFKEALNVTANRIPAQAFQSIMTMKVVGFSDAESNEAYVSHYQIWLQGSDYDIDKAYITSPIINDSGVYAPWSKLFKYNSRKVENPDGSSRIIDYFELSKQLPYPNFNEETNKHHFSNQFDESQQTLDVTDVLLNNTDAFEATVKILNAIDEMNGENVVLTYDPSLDSLKGDMIERIQKNIIQHNTQPSSDTELLQGSKNFIFNTIYTITNSLKNHVAAYSPIAMTDPQNAAANSKEGEKIKRVTTFTPTTKYNLFYANMAGKEGIGISAVGQKVFLAATQYFNQEAQRLSNLPNLTVEDLKSSNIWFSNAFDIYRRMKGNEGQETTKLVRIFANTLANLNLDNAPNVRNILDQAIEENRAALIQGGDLKPEDIDMISSRYYQTDKSLVISAVISAATDNAKELILDKINANPDLMGTYIYLIINGLEFSDIADLMTSDAVSAIKNAVNVNRMYDERESLDSVLNKLEKGLSPNGFYDKDWEFSIRRYLLGLKSKGIIPEVTQPNGKSAKSVKAILNGLDITTLNKIVEDLNSDKVVFTKLYATEEENFAYQESMENRSENSLYKESNTVIRGLLRYIGKLKDLKTLQTKLNSDITNFESFKKAFTGAKEIASLGRILGINGGAKTKLYDRYSFSKVFNDLLSDALAEATNKLEIFKVSNPSAVNIYNRFLSDANDGNTNFLDFNFSLDRFYNDSNYNRAVTDFYGVNKHIINVFDLVNKLPHYNAFLKAFLVNEDNLKLATIKYNLLMDITSKLESIIMRKANGTVGKLTDSQFSIIRDYIDELIIRKFLNHENIGIKVKTGDKFFQDGQLIEASTDMIYNLSDDDGLASFKYYMENTVIPMLKNGYTISSNGLRVSTPILSRNEFLNKLIVTDKKSSLDGSPYQHYRSAVNMLNTTDSIEFDKQITAFGAIENITFNGIKLSNLFLIYDLIVNKGRKGQGSLLKILQGSVYDKYGLASRYFQYIGEVDYNTSIPDIQYDEEGDKITLEDVNMDDVQMRLAPVRGSVDESIVGNKYVKNYDRETTTYQLQEVVDGQDENGNYSSQYVDIILDKNPNYYLFNSNLNSKFAESTNKSKTIVNLVDNVMNLIKTNKAKLIYRCE